jgi:uncharacterized repeat protein (TIGR03803 family)
MKRTWRKSLSELDLWCNRPGSGGTASGGYAEGSLIASVGTLYGMTEMGGANNDGTIFSVGTNGTIYQNLVSFTGTGGTANGWYPAGRLLAAGGTFYGMTASGGSNSHGNVFSVGVAGTNFHNLVSFTGSGGAAAGAVPYGSLIASGSTLYGMTSGNFGNGYGNIFSVGVNGTNYQNLVSFTGTGGTASGRAPQGSLILSGTTLYGMTEEGGVHGDGNIFSVGIDGSSYDDLYDFTGGTDGAYPIGDLLALGGTLFGMTNEGGANGDGTVFALAGVLPTPEPGTLALAAVAAIGLLGYGVHRRRVAKTARPPFDQQAPPILSFPSRSSAKAAHRAA